MFLNAEHIFCETGLTAVHFSMESDALSSLWAVLYNKKQANEWLLPFQLNVEATCYHWCKNKASLNMYYLCVH